MILLLLLQTIQPFGTTPLPKEYRPLTAQCESAPRDVCTLITMRVREKPRSFTRADLGRDFRNIGPSPACYGRMRYGSVKYGIGRTASVQRPDDVIKLYSREAIFDFKATASSEGAEIAWECNID